MVVLFVPPTTAGIASKMAKMMLMAARNSSPGVVASTYSVECLGKLPNCLMTVGHTTRKLISVTGWFTMYIGISTSMCWYDVK